MNSSFVCSIVTGLVRFLTEPGEGGKVQEGANWQVGKGQIGKEQVGKGRIFTQKSPTSPPTQKNDRLQIDTYLNGSPALPFPNCTKNQQTMTDKAPF